MVARAAMDLKIACRNGRINCYGSSVMKGKETQDVDLACNDGSAEQ
jgi:hypothetical protein